MRNSLSYVINLIFNFFKINVHIYILYCIYFKQKVKKYIYIGTKWKQYVHSQLVVFSKIVSFLEILSLNKKNEL